MGAEDLDQFFCRFFLLKAVFPVKLGRLEIPAALAGSPLSFKGMLLQGKFPQNAIKRSFHKLPDLSFPAHRHAQHTGHDPAHGNRLIAGAQIIGNCISVFQGQKAGKIDSHKIIFLGAQIRGGRQIVVFADVFCLPDSPDDLLLCLGIDPYTLLGFAPDACHICHQAVNIFSLTPGVCAHVNGLHIFSVQQPADDLKLLFHRRNDLVLKFLRQERQRLQAPFFQRRIVCFGIAHSDQMPHAPGNDRIFRLQIAVLSGCLYFQRLGKLLGYTWLFRDK